MSCLSRLMLSIGIAQVFFCANQQVCYHSKHEAGTDQIYFWIIYFTACHEVMLANQRD